MISILKFNPLIKCSQRTLSDLLQTSLVQYSFGHPNKVIKLSSNALQQLSHFKVLVKMKSACVHPIDVRKIKNINKRQNLPSPIGCEGYGEVIKVGIKVKLLKPGDHVIPAHFGFGTFTNYRICNEQQLIKIPKLLNPVNGALLNVYPSIAYRLMEDFKHLNKGEWIVQNNAGSDTSIYIIQLAKLRGLKTINIIRRNADASVTKQLLTQYGADLVFSPDELQDSGIVKNAKLGLNNDAIKGIRYLSPFMEFGGTIVTYNLPDNRPMVVPVCLMHSHNLTLCGSSINEWLQERHVHDDPDRIKMISTLARYFNDESLKPVPYNTYSLENWEDAFAQFMKPLHSSEGVKKKSVFIME